MGIQIDHARPEEKESVVSFLKKADLLTEDLPSSLRNFLLAKHDGTLIGVAGLEIFGSVGLLRSVAVEPACQGKGIAGQMVGQLLAGAAEQGLQAVYLITTTADHYFDRYGFMAVNREQVPEAIQQTRQFGSLCPSSAVVMKRNLKYQTG
ncbi:arsenic resistance N-acetyltransferase ArsN2 [Dyadobacter aurulentus]|uniref:arsenic resistance N-acetyltransferase ArsN2 n=1 Tax=Dyadobacter sp. UC 10 TaxID=2605428 RepID=UPI0011F3D225|nr:arsenic resistance N-acetyltransferase ArsN2 [Dyadobacter sp. UC 10]KAA0988827.1 GNAT family N-acetyltransferase [Dyadobacter sp. UC 10]